MKPVPKPNTVKVECPCGWSRIMKISENAEEAARYHRIQIHNDQEAVRAARVY